MRERGRKKRKSKREQDRLPRGEGGGPREKGRREKKREKESVNTRVGGAVVSVVD